MKQFLPMIMAILMLTLFAGANIYLSRRFAWYFGLEKNRAMYFLFASVTIYMIGGLIAFTNSTGIMGSLLYRLAAVLMGFLLYLLLSVIIFDLVKLIIKLSPGMYGISAIALALLVSIFSVWNAYQIKTIELEVGIKGLKQEVCVMHLTDLHLGHFRGKEYLQRILDLTDKQDVDAVFITGDLFDGRIRLSGETIEALTQLKIPVYFVEGNHDGYTGVERIKKALKEIGVIVLENQVSNWGEFQIIGLDHMLADSGAYNMHAAGNHATIKDILPTIKTDPEKPTILLHHSPDGIQYANEKGVDLYLAGHTHAGQMFPVNLLGKLLFDYSKGLHDYKGTKIYVSQGAGTFGPPMRLGTRIEITKFHLIPE